MRANEKPTSNGKYRGVRIFATSAGRYVVEYIIYYFVPTLQAAKRLVDDLFNARRN